MSSLVRVLTNTGKSVKHFTVDALTGKYYERLLKVPGIKNLEVSDPDLEANLTEDELRIMREKFPYLAPKERKPEPLPLGEAVVVAMGDEITWREETAIADLIFEPEPLAQSESAPPSIQGIPDEHTFVHENPITGKLRMADRPYENGKPVDAPAEETEPQAAKRGRKPKQA